jgi:hypothetical protein
VQKSVHGPTLPTEQADTAIHSIKGEKIPGRYGGGNTCQAAQSLNPEVPSIFHLFFGFRKLKFINKFG